MVGIVTETLLIVCLLLCCCALAKYLWPNSFGGPGRKPSPSTTAAEEMLNDVVFYNSGQKVYHRKECQRVGPKTKALTLCSGCSARKNKEV